MSRQGRANIAIGVILILIGAWFLAERFFPGLRLVIDLSWPMSVVAVGGVLLLLGLLLGQPGMAVPAAVVAGIGGLLYWQNATGEWSSWAYAWTLIPGFVGVGTLLAGLFGERPRQSAAHGINLIIISAVLFAIFASLFGGLDLFGPYWPVLLILLGLWLLGRALIYRRK